MFDLYLTNGAHLATVTDAQLNASLLYYRNRFEDRLHVVKRHA